MGNVKVGRGIIVKRQEITELRIELAPYEDLDYLALQKENPTPFQLFGIEENDQHFFHTVYIL